jgi:pyridoxine 4-dehydrogenase
LSKEYSASAAGTITIGGDLTVNRLGLGTNRITDTPEARKLLHRAVELGINFIDTADIYAATASETTIGKTLSPYPTGLVIATKGGLVPGGADGSPKHLKEALDASLKRLQLDRIDLYHLHRVDPAVPLEKSVQFLKEAREQGKIRHVGLSEVTIMQLEAARKIVPIASIQNRYNLLDREHDELVDYCEANGIIFIPYRPLGGTDRPMQEQLLDSIAKKHSATAQQLGLAWLLQRSPAILPIPGTLSVAHLEANIATAYIKLNAESLQKLDRLGQ